MTTARDNRHQVESDLMAGASAYKRWRAKLLADPQTRAIYNEEAAKKEVWLQLVEARMDAGLTQEQLAKRLGVSQAQVARIEKSGYDAYTLRTLRRYVEAIGCGLAVEVRLVRGNGASKPVKRRPTVASGRAKRAS